MTHWCLRPAELTGAPCSSSHETALRVSEVVHVPQVPWLLFLFLKLKTPVLILFSFLKLKVYYIVNTKENTDWRISREHRKAWRRKAEQRCPHVAMGPLHDALTEFCTSPRSPHLHCN